MILTGNEIARQVELGNITISPFASECLNPNSYNYSLGHLIRSIPPQIAAGLSTSAGPVEEIPSSGMQLLPGQLYLSHTKEVIGSTHFVISLIGRSSVGRLGLFVQISADMGNLGAAHSWTLELTCTQPIVVYPNMIIGQISFWTPAGAVSLYQGEYTSHSNPTPNLREVQ